MLKYPGRGIGVLLALEALKAKREYGVVEGSKDLLRVEALPRILKAISVEEFRVAKEKPHIIVDSLGNTLKINTKDYKFKAWVNVEEPLPSSLKTCIEEEKRLIVESVVGAFRELFSYKISGNGNYILSPIPTCNCYVLLDKYCPADSIELVGGDGWSRYVWRNNPYSIVKLSSPKTKIILETRSKDNTISHRGLKLKLKNGGILLRIDDLWWKITCNEGFEKVYSSSKGKYARILGGETEVLKLGETLILNSHEEVFIETWNTGGTLEYLVDFSKYTSKRRSVENVLCTFCGIRGVGGVGLGPLFNVRLEVLKDKVKIESNKNYKLRIVPFKARMSLYNPRVVQESMAELLPIQTVKILGDNVNSKSLVKSYPPIVTPLLIRKVEEGLRVLVWNAGNAPTVTRLEFPKFIREAYLSDNQSNNSRLVSCYGKILTFPLPPQGIEWLTIRFF